MSSTKIRAIWISIGALVLVAIVASVIALSGESNTHHLAGSPVPAASGGGANARRPVAQTKTTKTAPQTPSAPPAKSATKPPTGTPQGNGGDSDPDNNGGPDDSDGAI